MGISCSLSIQKNHGFGIKARRALRSNQKMDPDEKQRLELILNSASYKLAEQDAEFFKKEVLRPIRVQLELLKIESILNQEKIDSTIVLFGSSRIFDSARASQRLEAARADLEQDPKNKEKQKAVARAERLLAKSKYYAAAKRFSQIVSSSCQVQGHCDYVVTTGGGPGIMEAGNRGAFEVGAKSVGLNITLPAEQLPNSYITPELCFQFHYFAVRKMHFLLRAKALVVFPGGFGTLDELFDALTLRQTQRMQKIPIILFGKAFWDQVIHFQFLADEGVIDEEDLDLIDYAETPEEAWDIIARFHSVGKKANF